MADRIKGFEATPEEWDQITTIVRQEIEIDGGNVGDPAVLLQYMCDLWGILTDDANRKRMLENQAHQVPNNLDEQETQLTAALAAVQDEKRTRPVDPGPPDPPRTVTTTRTR